MPYVSGVLANHFRKFSDLEVALSDKATSTSTSTSTPTSGPSGSKESTTEIEIENAASTTKFKRKTIPKALKHAKLQSRLKLLQAPDLDTTHIIECFAGQGTLSDIYKKKFQSQTLIEKNAKSIEHLKSKGYEPIHADNMKINYADIPYASVLDLDAYSSPWPVLTKYLQEQSPPQYIALTIGTFLNYKRSKDKPAWLKRHGYDNTIYDAKLAYHLNLYNVVKARLKKHFPNSTVLTITHERNTLYLSAKVK